jgi:hypothetical protein
MKNASKGITVISSIGKQIIAYVFSDQSLARLMSAVWPGVIITFKGIPKASTFA